MSNADVSNAEVADIDWPMLRAKAAEAAATAYAPYSKLHVGAAAVTDTGHTAVGSNVENGSYGLTLCAECSLVGDLRRTGGRRLLALCASTPDGQILMPCGRCRQILYEFGGADLLIDTPEGPKSLGDLLPMVFELDV